MKGLSVEKANWIKGAIRDGCRHVECVHCAFKPDICYMKELIIDSYISEDGSANPLVYNFTDNQVKWLLSAINFKCFKTYCRDCAMLHGNSACVACYSVSDNLRRNRKRLSLLLGEY